MKRKCTLSRKKRRKEQENLYHRANSTIRENLYSWLRFNSCTTKCLQIMYVECEVSAKMERFIQHIWETELRFIEKTLQIEKRVSWASNFFLSALPRAQWLWYWACLKQYVSMKYLKFVRATAFLKTSDNEWLLHRFDVLKGSVVSCSLHWRWNLEASRNSTDYKLKVLKLKLHIPE